MDLFSINELFARSSITYKLYSVDIYANTARSTFIGFSIHIIKNGGSDWIENYCRDFLKIQRNP